MPGSRVYIGNMPSGVRERDLERFFKSYGRPSDVLIKQGFGFIEFEDYRDADDAVYELNGKVMKPDFGVHKVFLYSRLCAGADGPAGVCGARPGSQERQEQGPHQVQERLQGSLAGQVRTAHQDRLQGDCGEPQHQGQLAGETNTGIEGGHFINICYIDQYFYL